MANNKIFISCSRKDRAVAAALTELLVSGEAIEFTDITYSPLEDNSVLNGIDFISYVEQKLGNPGAVILLLSANYFSDRYCLCELGAIWAKNKNVVPLLVPPLRRQDVQRLFASTQLNQIDNTDDLNKLVVQLQGLLEWKNLSLTHWSVGKKKFLSVLQPLLR